MESGSGFSLPTFMGSSERLPSFAESDSAFSNTTEAESDMTEGGEEEGSITPRQTYFMCYATDLLSAYEQIKKRGLAGVRAIDDLCAMIKARVGLEETYAKGLDKVANQAFRDSVDPGTFREGLEGLRADLLNKAVQHRQLAKNLSTDVLEPLSELRGQLGSKTKALVARASKLQRDTRGIDEKYRRWHAKYVRYHAEAAVCLTAAVEGGAVPLPKAGPKEAGADRKGSSAKPGTGDGVGGSGGSGSGSGSASGAAGSRSTSGGGSSSSRKRAMSATLERVREAMPSTSNKKDLVQWFLPTEKNRKESLLESAQVAADAAEEARRTCLASWAALRLGIHGAVKEFQQVLTDFQGCEEQLVSQAQDGMRKHVVFESSALANQQYDLQMLFKVMETVNVEMDLRNFIRHARREVASDAVAVAQAAAAAENEALAAAAAGGGGGGRFGGAGGEARGSLFGDDGEGAMRPTSGTGAGVLSSRADSRGVALAFQRLFGIGQDLPPPPTEEPWSPPETEGEGPVACWQTLVDLFHVPLMTKEDISRYLDATDPVAGAAASEAAAAAIKALGITALAGEADNGHAATEGGGGGGLGRASAAAKDAQTDVALAKLPSHYPMVTPAASVYEVLGFAAQTRHAENYAAILAGASSSSREDLDRRSGGGGMGETTSGNAGGDGASVGADVGVRDATATDAAGSSGVVEQGGDSRAKPPSATPQGLAERGAAGAPVEDEKEVLTEKGHSSSSDKGGVGDSTTSSSGGVEAGIDKEALAKAAAAATASFGVATVPSTVNVEPTGRRSSSIGSSNADEGKKGKRQGGGGVAAVFAAAAAKFGAADRPKVPSAILALPDALASSTRESATAPTAAVAAAAGGGLSAVPTAAGTLPPPTLKINDNGTDTSRDSSEAVGDGVGNGDAPALAGTAEARAGAAATVASESTVDGNASGVSTEPSSAAKLNDETSSTSGINSSSSNSSNNVRSQSTLLSPCLALATERPSVFAATLADEVRELLIEDGAGEREENNGTDDTENVGRFHEGMGSDEGKDSDPAFMAVSKAVEALLRAGVEDGAGPGDGVNVDAAAKTCSESSSSSSRLLLALCQHACASHAVTASTTDATIPDDSDSADRQTYGDSASGDVSGRIGEEVPGEQGTGFCPVSLSPSSFAAFARLLRAALDEAASSREFLQARNCLVTSALFAVRGDEYVSWLRAAAAESGSSSGGGGGSELLAIMADSELVSAADALDQRHQLQGSRGEHTSNVGFPKDEGGSGHPGHDGGDGDKDGVILSGEREGNGEGKGTEMPTAAYLLQRELRRHPVWSTIELWEVSMSDSVVMSMEGGGARAERWLPIDTLDALRKRFGDDAAGRQLDVKLGQLAFLGHSMLVCGLPPSEVRSLLRKCSSLAMEIPPRDLDALMAVLDSYVMGSATPGMEQQHPPPRNASAVGGPASIAVNHYRDRSDEGIVGGTLERRRDSGIEEGNENREGEEVGGSGSSQSSLSDTSDG